MVDISYLWKRTVSICIKVNGVYSQACLPFSTRQWANNEGDWQTKGVQGWVSVPLETEGSAYA